MSSGGGNGDPSWAWLGLLKWSLQHVDGTKPSDESMKPMSEEDRVFLEKVMKEGIIDPGARMKELLGRLTISLKNLHLSTSPLLPSNESREEPTLPEEKEELDLLLDEDGMVDAIEKLRDIVEQVDFARDFVKMNGLPFLIGCASETGVPRDIRIGCLGVLSTLSQNNPPVQQAILETDGLGVLSGLYISEMDRDDDPDGSMRSHIVQVLSCVIRGHRVGEESFCRSEPCRMIIESGLRGMGGVERPVRLRRKCVFLLRALVCSDFSSTQRVSDFATSIRYVASFLTDAQVEEDMEIRENALALLVNMMKRGKGKEVVLNEKNDIVSNGVKRIAYLRSLPDGDEKEMALEEIELWEALITELAKATTGSSEENMNAISNENDSDEAPLMICP